MSSFSRGRFTRLVPLVLVAMCLLLVFSLQISPSSQSAATKSPIEKDTAANNEHAADEQFQKEKQRIIDGRRTVIEPGMLP